MSYAEMFFEAWPREKNRNPSIQQLCMMSSHILKSHFLWSHLKPLQIMLSMCLEVYFLVLETVLTVYAVLYLWCLGSEAFNLGQALALPQTQQSAAPLCTVP